MDFEGLLSPFSQILKRPGSYVARAERRHTTPNHFSKIFPGAISDRRRLLRFIAAGGFALWVPGWVSVYAFVFRTRGVI